MKAVRQWTMPLDNLEMVSPSEIPQRALAYFRTSSVTM